MFQWDDDDVNLVLDLHAELDFDSASLLKQQSADGHAAPHGHIILILSQPVFALSLHNAVFLAKKQLYHSWQEMNVMSISSK